MQLLHHLWFEGFLHSPTSAVLFKTANHAQCSCQLLLHLWFEGLLHSPTAVVILTKITYLIAASVSSIPSRFSLFTLAADSSLFYWQFSCCSICPQDSHPDLKLLILICSPYTAAVSLLQLLILLCSSTTFVVQLLMYKFIVCSCSSKLL